MTSPRRSSPADASSRQTKAALLAALRRICTDLRALQTSAGAIAAYREVEDMLAGELARLHPAAGGAAPATRRRARSRRPEGA